MNTSPALPPSLPERPMRDLDLGCRIGLLVLTFILGYAAVRLSWLFYSESVARIYESMLKGQPLPSSLRLAEGGKAQWMTLSCMLPVVAMIAVVAIRRPLTALLTISGCNLVLALITILLATALFAGFGQIVTSLS